MKKYFVHRVNRLSGNIPDAIWEKAVLLNDFSYPWRHEIPEETSFRALYDNTYLYLRYDVKDANINIYTKNNNKMDVVQSDRIEIFFRKNEDLKEYYCLEINPKGLVLDYAARYYRKFDFAWSWPKGHLFVQGNLNSEGYRVDLEISLESLKNLGLLRKNIIQAGIYRGDCISLPSDTQKNAVTKWITWVNPDTETPDFHVPSSFGFLELLSD